MLNNKIPTTCPSCSHSLSVTGLRCENCETEVNGLYSLPVLGLLAPEEQTFILEFFKESGKLNVMAKKMSVSYPTLRNRLDDLIEKVSELEAKSKQS